MRIDPPQHDAVDLARNVQRDNQGVQTKEMDPGTTASERGSSQLNPDHTKVPEAKQAEVHVQWEAGQVMILQFTDRRTGELIRQIPSEEVLNVFRQIQESVQSESPFKFETDV